MSRYCCTRTTVVQLPAGIVSLPSGSFHSRKGRWQENLSCYHLSFFKLPVLVQDGPVRCLILSAVSMSWDHFPVIYFLRRRRERTHGRSYVSYCTSEICQMLEELLQDSIKYITYKLFGNTSQLAHLGSSVLQFFLLSLLLLMKQLLFGFRLKYIF